ncbi:DUF2169 domain-containing protein [Buttiauxella sp. A2-C2_NF]|uniref:DUF2169 family type VI secretion system accessory protein n=1 Tax=Buttiauxella ferragutiae TaxID=82989 RepID=UPI001E4AD842|nr:DUF2169 domain-containing protein [Buttiauxella ferragutiae]MCE0826400.1 DUF2169 domain-containing protein [Buttiauxella ferragutiae]UNK60696.1 DUF2169 domain-containing protein [Buttiauxella ferragutiae]
MSVLPEPKLRILDNQTGLTTFQYDKMAPGKVFHDVVVVKASFNLLPGGLCPIPQPAVLFLADKYRQPDNPMGSSLLQAGDLVLGKPGTDILVTGSVYADCPTQHFQTGLRISNRHNTLVDYTCIATGKRCWQHTERLGWHMSEPALTEHVPIAYELAYGGRNVIPDTPPEEWEIYAPNPSGNGFSFAGYSTDDQFPAPQWEPKEHQIGTKPPLTGFGPVARHWLSRQKYAGTYDEKWRDQLKDNPPYLDYPDDFDLRFFQCAHPSLQSSTPLNGNEKLEFFHLIKGIPHLGTWLPALGIAAYWQEGITARQSMLPLDTVHIATDENTGQGRIDLVWRWSKPHHLNIHELLLRTVQLPEPEQHSA